MRGEKKNKENVKDGWSFNKRWKKEMDIWRRKEKKFK